MGCKLWVNRAICIDVETMTLNLFILYSVTVQASPIIGSRNPAQLHSGAMRRAGTPECRMLVFTYGDIPPACRPQNLENGGVISLKSAHLTQQCYSFCNISIYVQYNQIFQSTRHIRNECLQCDISFRNALPILLDPAFPHT